MYVYIYACMHKFCHAHTYMAKLDRTKKRNKQIHSHCKRGFYNVYIHL